MRRQLRLVVIPLAALTACGGPTHKAADPPKPATLRAVPGSALREVVLSPDAAKRLAVATTPVLRDPADPARTEIPLTALVYDPEGGAWTYTALTAPRTYLRKAVTVARTDGGTVQLSSGPAAGTPVVDVAAPELLGTEYGVGEE